MVGKAVCILYGSSVAVSPFDNRVLLVEVLGDFFTKDIFTSCLLFAQPVWMIVHDCCLESLVERIWLPGRLLVGSIGRWVLLVDVVQQLARAFFASLLEGCNLLLQLLQHTQKSFL